MLLQKEKQSIEEIGKKDKKIYERRKVSLSNIYDPFIPPKESEIFSDKCKRTYWRSFFCKSIFLHLFSGKD